MKNIFYGNDTVSGTGIRYDMNANGFTFSWKNNFDIENNMGKAITSGFDARMPSSRYNGHSAPAIALQGFIDTSLPPGTNPLVGSVGVQINEGALGSLQLIGSGYLYYPMVNKVLLKAPFDTSTSTFSMGGSVPVVINSVSYIPDLNTFNGSEYIINYSMNLTVVSGPV